nr:cytochrome P450 monooxygenase [Panus rudis]
MSSTKVSATAATDPTSEGIRSPATVPPGIMLVVALIIGAYILRGVCDRTKGKRIPGPFQWPIVGNTLSVEQPYRWTWFEDLRNKYGNIFQVKVYLDNIIVLSDPKMAEDLFGRRAANYSSRKNLPYSNKYRSGNKRMLLMTYGPEFVKQRTAMQIPFKPEGILSNRARQKQQFLRVLIDFMDAPGEWREHLKSYSSGVALGVAFGMPLELARIRKYELLASTESLGKDLVSGNWLSDTFPALDLLPDFLSPWRKSALKAHEHEVKMFSRWSDEAKNRPAGSVLQHDSVINQLWEHQEELGLDDESILYVAGIIGEAGTNTTQCMISCFLYAMSIWPDLGKKAQEELDRVVGSSRTPQFSDFYDLPHVFAVTKETLRWIPVTPLAMAHLASEDDVYQGYHIPKDSLVMSSLWNMHRDPANFDNPDIFDPMRFYEVTPEGKVPPNASLNDGIYTFGFGRRSCPGRRMAMDSVWIAVSHFLWAFNITRDPKQPIPENYFDGIVWRDTVNVEPKILPIQVSLRSPERGELIRQEYDALMAGTQKH